MGNKYHKRGSLLLEILIVIGVVAIIIPVVAQVVVTSLNSNKWTTENKVAAGLADETIKAVENVSFEKWQNIYSKIKGATNHYYPTKDGGAWTVALGDESLMVNGLSYVRYFTIFDVCRDDITKEIITNQGIPPCTAGNSDDPSTQKITVTVNWTNGTLIKDYYLTRWRNKVCHQTSWSGTGSGAVNCPSTLYESATNIDTSGTPGSLKLQAN
jgi:type II secretory pathway pseudopilin PulG